MQHAKPVIHKSDRRPRPPPRLRTKTGCLTCRSRRKKCNERKPRCDGCKHLGIPCVWPEKGVQKAIVPESTSRLNDSASGPSRSNSASGPNGSPSAEIKSATALVELSAVPSPPLQVILHARIPCLPYKPMLRSQEEDLLFLHFEEKVVPLLVRPHAHQGFKTDSYTKMYGMDIRCVIDVVLAVAATHLSGKEPRYRRTAIEYYCSAIAGLRTKVEEKSIDGGEDWLLLMTIVLLLYERWSPDPISNASTHILGAIQIFDLRLRRLRGTGNRKVSRFERVMAESILYHSAILSFHVDFDPHVLSDFFDSVDYIYKSPSFTNAASWTNSPILGVGSELYHVVCKISQLCRRTPLQPEDQLLLGPLADELRRAEKFEEQSASRHADDVMKLHCFNSSKLYVLASRIIIHKLRYPQVQATDDWVQVQVREAMDILESLPKAYGCEQYLCWPIFVIGCGLIRDSDILLMRQTLKDIWQSTFCGDDTRASAALEAGWEVSRQRKLGAGSNDQLSTSSGLDMLVHTTAALHI